MKNLLLLICLAAPLSLVADDDAFRSIVRGILAPPVEHQAPAAPKVVRQYPFNPDYPNVYLGDSGADNVSIFIEAISYGRSEQSYYVLLQGKSSAGAFQKKISFTELAGFLHLQGVLEQQQYERIYFYSEGRSASDYTLQAKPIRTAPRM